MSQRQAHELLYFWAIGDLHYRALPAWQDAHAQRLNVLFADVQALWQEEGAPDFCVSPGDIVDTCAVENHTLAKSSLEKNLGPIPFYPGIGNHEYYDPARTTKPAQMIDTYQQIWGKPLRYSWQVGDTLCIMLDYPNPYTLEDPLHIYLSQETLLFLENTLAEYPTKPGTIFLHCPLYNTVLDRNTHLHDYHSLEHFFSLENSQEVRDILSRHRNVGLFFSGHTHSGWDAPNQVTTETLGDHSVTFVNLMSPWYTGRGNGASLNEDGTTVSYISDDPDVTISFAVHIYRQHASIRARDHQARRWLKEWQVPLS